MADKNELAVLDRAYQKLAKATTIGEVVDIRNRAEAVRAYAKTAKQGLELQNKAAEIKLAAERKAGTVLSQMSLRGGDRKSKGHRAPLILEELGISRHESKRWQNAAKVPEKDFKHYIRAKNQLGEEVTFAGLIRIMRETQNGKSTSSTLNRARSNGHSEDLDTLPAKLGDTLELIVELMEHCKLLGTCDSPRLTDTSLG